MGCLMVFVQEGAWRLLRLAVRYVCLSICMFRKHFQPLAFVELDRLIDCVPMLFYCAGSELFFRCLVISSGCGLPDTRLCTAQCVNLGAFDSGSHDLCLKTLAHIPHFTCTSHNLYV